VIKTIIPILVLCLATAASAQQALTWEEVRHRFELSNPTLRAAQLSIDEAKAQEVTAYLRPNPDFTLSTDGTQLTPSDGTWRPFAGTQFTTSLSYLHERGHKRELRLESARGGTAIAESQLADQERNLLFNLRSAFVQALQARAVLAVARENLGYYDRMLGVNGDRFRAGDIAKVDFDRLQLQRIQFESDVQNATVNMRTAKIQLQMLLNDRTPVEQFDVTGPFEFQEPLTTLDELHRVALATRPDLRVAQQTVDKAKADYRLAVANSTTDPTFASWYSRNPSFNNPFDTNTIGASVSIPLRIFDRNQGEKARTQLEIRRSERLLEATNNQIFNDVDSAWATLNSTLALLRPYKSNYLNLATSVRETISFAYQSGGSSLLDFLNAQNDYRSTYLNYQNLIGSFLNAANQLNMAVGREVIR